MTTNKEENISKNEHTINEAAVIRKLSLVSIVGNAALSGFKLFAGIFGHSGAMISDAIHSLSDVLTTVIAFIGVKISQKAADKSHPYSHESMECIASLSFHAHIKILRLFLIEAGDVHIVPNDTEGRIVALGLSYAGPHFLCLVIQAVLLQCSGGKAQEIEDVPIRPDKRAVRLLLDLLGLVTGETAQAVGHKVRQPAAAKLPMGGKSPSCQLSDIQLHIRSFTVLLALKFLQSGFHTFAVLPPADESASGKRTALTLR